MCNFNPTFSDEGLKAIDKYLKSKSAYLNSAGDLLNDPFVDTTERVLWALSGEVS